MHKLTIIRRTPGAIFVLAALLVMMLSIAAQIINGSIIIQGLEAKSLLILVPAVVLLHQIARLMALWLAGTAIWLIKPEISSSSPSALKLALLSFILIQSGIQFWQAVTGASSPNVPSLDFSTHGAIFLQFVIFAPLAETLLQVLLLEAAKIFNSRKYINITSVAVIFGIMHAASSLQWIITGFILFFTLSLYYENLRESNGIFLSARAIYFAHTINNIFAFILIALREVLS